MLALDQYTHREALLLLMILQNNFGLDGQTRFHRPGAPRIMIKQRHYYILQHLCADHMHPSLQ